MTRAAAESAIPDISLSEVPVFPELVATIAATLHERRNVMTVAETFSGKTKVAGEVGRTIFDSWQVPIIAFDANRLVLGVHNEAGETLVEPQDMLATASVDLVDFAVKNGPEGVVIFDNPGTLSVMGRDHEVNSAKLDLLDPLLAIAAANNADVNGNERSDSPRLFIVTHGLPPSAENGELPEHFPDLRGMFDRRQRIPLDGTVKRQDALNLMTEFFVPQEATQHIQRLELVDNLAYGPLVRIIERAVKARLRNAADTRQSDPLARTVHPKLLKVATEQDRKDLQEGQELIMRAAARYEKSLRRS